MLFTTLKTDMAQLELSLLDPSKGLSNYISKLDKLGERICYVSDGLSLNEYQQIREYYLNLIFNYLACISYYGDGNKNSLKYLIKRDSN